MRKFSNLIIAASGALLLWAAWPVSPFTFFIFFAFVPLLWMEDRISSTKKLLGLAYLQMLLWNLLTTWWIYYASGIGAALAIILNSLIMCLPWVFMHWTKKIFGALAGYLSLIAYWISFEYIHHNWELSWPWLTLGNVFSMQPGWVQWYEATGSTGGTLWVLTSNILFYNVLSAYKSGGRSRVYLITLGGLLALLVIPILLSKNISKKLAEAVALSSRNATKNVVIVQPNVDPYEEKFAAGSQEAQIERLIALSEQQVDSNTALVLWPETAIAVGLWEDEIAEHPYYQPVWSFIQRHPRLSLLSGIDSRRNYGLDKKNATATARYDEEQKFYYDAFNTSAMMYPSQTAQFYHKAKLVPGVETLPSFLLWMGNLFDDLGGTSGTLGRDKERIVFPDQQHYYMTAPVICYESIYSEYITDYIRKGANLLTIMTNDGWWDNTPGYKQHMNYARLRAIETRRWVARSANTGISCFIDPLGNIYQPQPWDTSSAIKMTIEPLQAQTFFVRHGDYISRIFNVVSILFLLLLLFSKIRQRFSSKTASDK